MLTTFKTFFFLVLSSLQFAAIFLRSSIFQILIKMGQSRNTKWQLRPWYEAATLFCQSNKQMLSGFDCLLLIVPKLMHDRWRELIIPANKQANKVIFEIFY